VLIFCAFFSYEISWELLDYNEKRIKGDQLLNDHETRFYKFCLPREVVESSNNNDKNKDSNDDDYNDDDNGSGSMANEGNDDDHDDQPSEINIDIKSIEPNNTNDDENNEDTASVTTSSTTNTTSTKSDGTIMPEQQQQQQQQQQRCYTLNVHDRWNDGIAIKNRIGWNDADVDVDVDDENENENPAGYGIRFGMADKYEDFSFPDFGRTASFRLCPGSATINESLGTATTTTTTTTPIVEDYIIVVHTDAPTPHPSDAPNSDTPPILPGEYLVPFDYFSTTNKMNFAGKLSASSNLRGGIGIGIGAGRDRGGGG
jgi:hypothetical protein